MLQKNLPGITINILEGKRTNKEKNSHKKKKKKKTETHKNPKNPCR